MEKIVANYYGVLPSFVRYDNKLSPVEKLLYCEITAVMNRHRYCMDDVAYFAEKLKVDESCIFAGLKNLQDNGHIKVKVVDKESKEIAICPRWA